VVKTKIKPLPKIIGLVLIVLCLFFAFKQAQSRGVMDKLLPKDKNTQNIPKDALNALKKESTLTKPITVGVVTWGGYAGGQYFNKGFEASQESRYWQDYKILVQFKVIDDFIASREAFKSGDIDVLWITADSFPTEAGNLGSFDPKIIFQADWSRGGDAIVVRRGINSANELKGKKVAVAFGTPSHTFLLNVLSASGLAYTDIEVVEVPSAIDAAVNFKSGKVDAAVVWSPDDADCVANVTGAKVLKSTKEASNIIADVFYVKNDYLQKHKDELKSLVEGWMIGAAEINSNQTAKDEAAQILAKGLNQPVDFCKQAISNVRLATYGDNVNFFNLQGTYKNVKGEDLYSKMTDVYTKIGLIKDRVPTWREVVDTSILSSVTGLDGGANVAEKTKEFTKATVEVAKSEAFSTKRVTISFLSGVSNLDDNSKYIIDKEFVDIAKSFGNSRIRIEGNTDIVGNPNSNKTLSLKRAQAVVDYLVNEHSFNSNRFVVVGNGSDKPVASNDTEDGKAKNRRTDFELLNQ